MAEEIIDGNLTIDIEKPEEKLLRDVAHDYVDHNGWCRDCGRSEGWRAHSVKEEEAPPKKMPSINPETGEPTVAPVVEDTDDLTTGPLELPDERTDED